jgi:hypothetical protein
VACLAGVRQNPTLPARPRWRWRDQYPRRAVIRRSVASLQKLTPARRAGATGDTSLDVRRARCAVAPAPRRRRAPPASSARPRPLRQGQRELRCSAWSVGGAQACAASRPAPASRRHARHPPAALRGPIQDLSPAGTVVADRQRVGPIHPRQRAITLPALRPPVNANPRRLFGSPACRTAWLAARSASSSRPGTPGDRPVPPRPAIPAAGTSGVPHGRATASTPPRRWVTAPGC